MGSGGANTPTKVQMEVCSSNLENREMQQRKLSPSQGIGENANCQNVPKSLKPSPDGKARLPAQSKPDGPSQHMHGPHQGVGKCEPSNSGVADGRDMSTRSHQRLADPESQLLGTWVFLGFEYTISETNAGNRSLKFTQSFPNGEHASSILSPHGPWWQGNVVVDGARQVGMVRFRMGMKPMTLVSTFKQPGNDEWAPCRLATRTTLGEPSRLNSIIDAAATWFAKGRAPTPDPETSPHHTTRVPIKNTFIQYDTNDVFPDFFVWWHTAPSVMLQRSFKLNTPNQKAHLKGQCTPCHYFRLKKDGCRMGKNCEFCHTCDFKDIKKKRKDKKKALKEYWAEHAGS